MKPRGRSSLYLPGENERELWTRASGGAWEKAKGAPVASETVYAIECLLMDSVPFWAVAPQDGKLDISGVSSLKWESLGITEASEGRSVLHWKVGQIENRVLVGSAGLVPDGPNAEWLAFMPQSFEISPRLQIIPDGEIAVWKELGRYVAAFSREKRLVHFSVLSARELSRSAAQEIGELALSLEIQGLMNKPVGVRVWTDASSEFTAALKCEIAAPVRLEPRPAPVLPEDACDIFPPEVERARRSRLQKRQRTHIALALAAAYTVFFTAWAGWLTWREHKLESNKAVLEQKRPALEELVALKSRWQALESATNADLYPVELFQRIVSLLPDEGIRLKEFQLEHDKLIVSGEASTVGHAMKFKSDLTGSDGLRGFAWIFPQPTILDDNRASFRAEGSTNQEGGVDEAK